MARVLVVDDDAGIRESVAIAAEKSGHAVFRAASVASARALLATERVDVVVSDIYMPGDTGLVLLDEIRELDPRPATILMTARGSLETAALAERGEAFDYIAKPFDLVEMMARIAAAVAPVRHEILEIEPAPPSMMVGAHPSMIALYRAISKIAPLAVPVLVRGESGTGKELVARALHSLGSRPDGPFVALNCGAVPDTLLESELFGHIRGAFTDARQDRRGALVRADGGTLFLDEIGDVSPAFQVRLLRFLQEGTVTPLGSEKELRVAVRVIAATHRDLRAMVAAGRFREDLYFRLAGYEIGVPALRERASDIPLLVDHFRRKLAGELGRAEIEGPSRALIERLTLHPWQGNIRELEQAVRRIAIDTGALTDAVAAGRVLREMSGPSSPSLEIAPAVADASEPEAGAELGSLDDAEKRHILAVLEAARGNQTQAAFILGIERKTLARKMKRYGIEARGRD
ncbi:MAG: sigma-54-dependent Fis family transcriptional regulator [Acidobacteria bacterium]|nr:sigma-54-dependent Fis family transcriptional regulator [Acidobacteriota bacterium]